jgi:alanyl-tRNA synthetase
MAEQKRAARAAWTGSGAQASEQVWFDIAEVNGATDFIGYSGHDGQGVVVALVKDGEPVERAVTGDTVAIVTNQTPFYGESGGQVGDAGIISGDNGLRAVVEDTSKPLGKLHAHQARIESGDLKVGDAVSLHVDAERRTRTRANHSATHLLHAALRKLLGAHVTQKGSLVAPDRLRFDFSHPKALSPQEIAAIEAEVNAHIRTNTPVATRLMTPEEAIAEGAMALFGEKYGDEVRVLSMGLEGERNYSVELCGGTHVNALGDIALFKIVAESAVSAGVRRIEALTGEAARAYLTEQEERLKAAAAALKARPDEVAARVAALVEERRKLERELAEAKRQLALGGGRATEDASATETVAGVGFIGQVIDGLDAKNLRGLIDEAKKKLGSGVAVMVAVNEGRAGVAVGVTDDLTSRLSAVDLVRVASAALGGQGGGGRPDMAQAGGPDGSKAAEAVAAVRQAIEREAVAA